LPQTRRSAKANAGRSSTPQRTERHLIEVVQAFDQAPIARLDSDDAAALDRKIEAARRLFADRDAWLKPYRRIEVLGRLAGLMEGKREHLGRQIPREGGKPLTDAFIEVDRAIDGVRNAVDELRVMAGREIPMGLKSASTDRRAFTIVEPIGVVAAVSAFNHPLNLIVHQIVPAVAVGCPVIVKPASPTPLSCIDFVHCCTRPGCRPIGVRSSCQKPTNSPRRLRPIPGSPF
jgi:acyl-CoA reductase-like NAD-dependent aldehyde dehydrogenase